MKRTQPRTSASAFLHELEMQPIRNALRVIDKKINAVQQALTQLQAPDDVCNQALAKLQQLRQKVETESSIPQVLYLQERTGDVFDEAMGVVAVYRATLPPSKRIAPQPECEDKR